MKKQQKYLNIEEKKQKNSKKKDKKKEKGKKNFFKNLVKIKKIEKNFFMMIKTGKKKIFENTEEKKENISNE